MRSNIFTILKKELKRVFLDRKLAFAVFIMPGLTIAIIYSLMGGMIDKLGDDASEHIAVVHTINMPAEFRSTAADIYGTGMVVVENRLTEKEEIIEFVVNGDADVLLIFENNFMEKVMDGLPAVAKYTNSIKDFSVSGGYMVDGVLETMRRTILAERLGSSAAAMVFTVNYEDVAKAEEKAGKAISMLLPMLLTIFLFAGAMQVGMDIIAGEKERGTIATMLLTPVKRGHIAIGKMLSLAIVSLASCLSSMVGVLLSLPFSKTMFGGGFNLSDLSYGVSDFLLMIAQMAAMALSFVSIICLLSAVARNIKEAGGYIAPAYMVIMVVSMSTMFMKPEGTWSYTIPIYGNILNIKDILTFNYAHMSGIISLAVTLVFTSVMAWLMVRTFYNERIMKTT
jgi:sodium transport system permease protein